MNMHAVFTSSMVDIDVRGIFLTMTLMLAGLQAATYIYNLFFHPLKNFPGPILCKISTLPFAKQSINGDGIFWITKLHEKYGEVVRFSPNELSFNGANAFKDIYGARTGGYASLQKDPELYGSADEVEMLGNANDVNHARQRRIIAPAFTNRALKLQEPLLAGHADHLIKKLYKRCTIDGEHVVDMAQMFRAITFDIMGDLALSESLRMLDDSEHAWITAARSFNKYGPYIRALRYHRLFRFIMRQAPFPYLLRRQISMHEEFAIQCVDRRLKNPNDRPDLWGLILEHGDAEPTMSRNEMYNTAMTFMFGGTQTTADLLSGLTYYLSTHPDKMRTVTSEVRNAFTNDSQMTLERLQALTYLNACIDEALRMFPPVTGGLSRVTQPGHTTLIDGHIVPEGAKVGVTVFAAMRNPNNFRDPAEFVPERWLPESSDFYSDDKIYAFQPFSLGPRGCLGKSMAYHEARLVLAKLVYNFDVVLCEESKHWADQKNFLIWESPPLRCQLRPRDKV